MSQDDDVTDMLKSLFQKYDDNDSGCLGQDEIKQLLETDFGMTEDEIYTFSLLLDKDGSATLTFDEFSKVIFESEVITRANQCRAGVIQKAVELFKKYDVDKSHALCKDEFQKLYLDIDGRHDYIDSVMGQVDFDTNGKISFNEFLRWLSWVPMEVFQE